MIVNPLDISAYYLFGLIPLVLGMAAEDSTWMRTFLENIENDVKTIKQDHEIIRQELREKLSVSEVKVVVAESLKAANIVEDALCEEKHKGVAEMGAQLKRIEGYFIAIFVGLIGLLGAIIAK